MNIASILPAVIIVLVGLSFFWPARKARNQDKIRQSWPTVKGTVTSSSVVPATMAVPSDRAPEFFDAIVKYQFRAGGQLHFGDTVSFLRQLWKEEKALSIVARYPAGAPVTVHYNMENILECYLEFVPSVESRGYSVGIALFGVAGLILVLALFGII